MPDHELDAMRAAYEHLKGLDRRQWTRALEYISRRMAEDDRASYIKFETTAPVQWVIAGDISDPYESPSDAVAESYADPLTVIEVNGIATVRQRFAVMIPTDDSRGEAEWFGTRAEAEACVAHWMARAAS